MMSPAATDQLAASSSSSSLPCPSCGGATSEEFVANGPSKGLRTTCSTCGPIDVMGISVMDLPEDDPADAEEESPFRFVETSREEPRDPEPPAGLSFAGNEDPAGELSFAESGPADEPVAEAEEPAADLDYETPEASTLADDASSILEEVGPPPDGGGPAPGDETAEIGTISSVFEPAPGVGQRRGSRTKVDGPAQARNRQVVLAAIGGFGAIAALIGLDLYLRPIDPAIVAHQIPRRAEAAIPPSPAAKTAETVVQPAETADVASPASPAVAVAKAAVVVAQPAATRPDTRPAAVESKPTLAAAAEPARPVAETEAPSPRWFSQTGAPPSRRNVIVNAGNYAAGADRAQAAPAVARPEAGAAVREEPVQVALRAQPPNPAWRRLRPGMSAAEVARVLGPPRWTEKSVALHFWMYENQSILGSGVVVFDNRGLYSWREPSQRLPQS